MRHMPNREIKLSFGCPIKTKIIYISEISGCIEHPRQSSQDNMGAWHVTWKWHQVTFLEIQLAAAMSLNADTEDMFDDQSHHKNVSNVCMRQAIIWTNAGILLIEPLKTNFSEILIEIYIFSTTKMHLKLSSEFLWPFCLGLNVL